MFSALTPDRIPSNVMQPAYVESKIAAWIAAYTTKNDKKKKSMEEVAVESAWKVQKHLLQSVMMTLCQLFKK